VKVLFTETTISIAVFLFGFDGVVFFCNEAVVKHPTCVLDKYWEEAIWINDPIRQRVPTMARKAERIFAASPNI